MILNELPKETSFFNLLKYFSHIIYDFENYLDCDCKVCEYCGVNDAIEYHCSSSKNNEHNCYENRICCMCDKNKMMSRNFSYTSQDTCNPIISQLQRIFNHFLIMLYLFIFSLSVSPLILLMFLTYYIQNVCSETLNKIYIHHPIFQSYQDCVNKITFNEMKFMNIFNKLIYFIIHLKEMLAVNQIERDLFYYLLLMIISYYTPYFSYFIILPMIIASITKITFIIIYIPFIILYSLMTFCMFVHILTYENFLEIIDKYGFPIICSDKNRNHVVFEDIKTNIIIKKTVQVPLIILNSVIVILRICLIFICGDKN